MKGTLTLLSYFFPFVISFLEDCMGLFEKLGLSGTLVVDWEMTPDYTFGTFESWGGKERVRSQRERIYYFFIDAWDETPKLCLMERGIKHAKVVGEILAPVEMLKQCVADQGKPGFDKSYAIDKQLEAWLKENIIESEDDSRIVPVIEPEKAGELKVTGLPSPADQLPKLTTVQLPSESAQVNEEDLPAIFVKYNFFESQYNPEGRFSNYLVDNGDGLTVSDRVTGLMWQRGGADIMSFRRMRVELERVNKEAFAGHSDWRFPTIEEALSLMEPEMNARGIYLHPSFSAEQPFICVAAKRDPGGYWFVDFKQARVFWSSGTIPGGFGRFCRNNG